MKILLTGGGTGGHFYPLMAVAKALNAVADQEKIANLELVYMAEHPYDKNILLQNGIKFKKIYSGFAERYRHFGSYHNNLRGFIFFGRRKNQTFIGWLGDYRDRFCLFGLL